jgi:hypothetical protein
MATRWARFTRGMLAAIFSTLVASISHTLAGGDSPGLLALVIGLVFASLTCVALTGKRLSLTRLAIAVAISQFGFHGLFSSMGDFSGTVAVTHDHLTGTTVMTMPADVPAHHTGALMWLAHGVAALITIVALRHGESAFWSLRDLAGRVIRRLVTTGAAAIDAPIGVRLATAARPFAPRFFVLLSSSLRYRGPPVALVA